MAAHEKVSPALLDLQFPRYLAIFGYSTLFLAACLIHTFVDGSLYLLSFFLVTLSMLIRLLIQSMSSNRNSERCNGNFFHLLSMVGVGYCMFADVSIRSMIEKDVCTGI